MKFAINSPSRISLAITACVLSFSHTAKAARSQLHGPAFTCRHAASSVPLSAFGNTANVSPFRGVTSTHRYPTSIASANKSSSWMNKGHTQRMTSGYRTSIQLGSTCLFASPDENESTVTTGIKNLDTKQSSIVKDAQNIIALVGAQGLLIPMSIALANVLNLPNRGLGPSFLLGSGAFIEGVQWTIPLFALAGIMKLIEPYSPALQDVTKATQRSVLAVMGSKRRPFFALLVSLLLGAVAGWG